MNNDFLKIKSRHLANTLDIAGASEYIRKTSQHGTLVVDVLTSLVMIFEGSNVTIYTFGSRSEGTTTPGLDSDTDTLMCFRMFPVFEKETDSLSEVIYERSDEDNENSEGYILMISDDSTPKGYTKLAFVGNRETKQQFISMLHEVKDTNGKHVLSNNGMIEAMARDELNGPAATTLKRPGFTDLDYIPAFRCKKWPQAANEFLTRKREHDFPSKNVKKDFGNLGIFLVPTGHSESPECDLQWRLSFSLQERKIMMNLNEAQFKCYILLKMMKQDFIKSEVPGKSLTSYHCKTSVFFLIEELGHSVWTIDNLLECFITCVRLLRTWIKKGFIPSYFMPEVNLWRRDKEVCCKVCTILEKFLEDVTKSLMSLKCDGVGVLLHDSVAPLFQNKQTAREKDPKGDDYLKVARRDLHLTVHRLHYNLIVEAVTMVSYFLLLSRNGDDLDKCMKSHRKLVALLENTSKLSKTTSQEIASAQEAASYVLPFVYTSLGSQLATKAMLTSDERLHNEAMFYLHKGQNSDVLAGNLKLAAVLYAQQKYEKCLQLLDDLNNNLGSDVVTLAMCGNDSKYYNCTVRINQKLIDKMVNQKPTSKDVLWNNVATCVQFLPTELPLIPKDLQYEMFRSFGSVTEKHPDIHGWYDIVAVDSKIFLNYLVYLVHKQLGNEREKELP